MKRRRFSAIFIIFVVLGMLLGATNVYAQTTSLAVISSYVIKNDAGSDVTQSSLMAGAKYTVFLEISVSAVPSGTRLSLSTPMEKAAGQDVYWQLENDYEGIDTELWQPGQSVIEFDAVKGVAEFVLEGSIAADYTTERISNAEREEYLHFPDIISLVTISLGVGGELLDQRPSDVIDQVINDYQIEITEKRNLLQTSDVEAEYSRLAANIVEEAEILSNDGYVERAQDILETLPSSTSDLPTQESETSVMPYIVIIIVIAIVLVILAILFLRARSSSSFIRQQVDEEAGRLDVLSVKISKIDKRLAGDIEQVKEQLERISGR